MQSCKTSTIIRHSQCDTQESVNIFENLIFPFPPIPINLFPFPFPFPQHPYSHSHGIPMGPMGIPTFCTPLMLTCKITLPDSRHPISISKNSGFRALYLARRHEFRRFRLIYTRIFFFIFGCWLLPEKFSFCPKNNSFAAPQLPWIVRL